VGGRSGAVTILQRFGGALNLNIHVHALVLDGSYVKDARGRVAFHPVGDFTALDVTETLQDSQVGITRLLERWRRDDANWVDDAPGDRCPGSGVGRERDRAESSASAAGGARERGARSR
jgi:hypothetical protein